jgi:hypothetical protein
MLKLLQLRLMFLACWLLLPASAYADAVSIGFGEDVNAFSLTLTGSAVQSDFTYDVSKGNSWRVTFTVTKQVRVRPTSAVRNLKDDAVAAGPALKVAPGVYVHFHDVCFPFEYPEEWMCQGRAWNEAYLLRAFLQ